MGACDYPLKKSSEATGCGRGNTGSSSTVTGDRLEDRCVRLQQEWVDAEFQRQPPLTLQRE